MQLISFPLLIQVKMWCISIFNIVLQILHNHQERQTIVQQIIDLKWLQQNEEIDYSAKISRLKEKKSSPSLYNTLKKLDEKINGQAQNSQDLATNVLEKDRPIVEPSTETLPSTFSQLDNLSSSSIIDLPLHGELFWTCKSPLRSNQVRELSVWRALVLTSVFNMKIWSANFSYFAPCFGGMHPFGYMKIWTCTHKYAKNVSDKSQLFSIAVWKKTLGFVHHWIIYLAYDEEWGHRTEE